MSNWCFLIHRLMLVRLYSLVSVIVSAFTRVCYTYINKCNILFFLIQYFMCYYIKFNLNHHLGVTFY